MKDSLTKAIEKARDAAVEEMYLAQSVMQDALRRLNEAAVRKAAAQQALTESTNIAHWYDKRLEERNVELQMKYEIVLSPEWMHIE